MGNEIRLADVGEDGQPVGALFGPVNFDRAFRAAKNSGELVKSFLPNVWRMGTQRLRHLPTTVIIGAQDAGTEQLYAYLVTHPRCFAAARREIDYFSQHAARSMGWYRSRFPLSFRVMRRRGHVIEASPSYLPTPSALRKMKQALPKARVIVLLSDPVSRAFSHFQRRRIRQLESRDFAECVAQEIRANEFPARFGVGLETDAEPLLGYVARGYYALQLELLLKVYPRNKVLLMDSSSLFDNAVAACQRVFDFMGLEAYEVEPAKIDSRGFHQETIDPRVAAQLREHYRPYDALLELLLEQRFSWMANEAQKAAA